MNRKVIYFKNFAKKIDTDFYNSQEIGMGKAFVDHGVSCDIISYIDRKSFLEQKESNGKIIYEKGTAKMRLYYYPAFCIFSNALYFRLLNRKLLNSYDLIITTEYHQIMSALLAFLCPEKTILYHGPYQDNQKKVIQWIYDLFFLPLLKRRLNYSFVKSNFAKNYLVAKGMRNIYTIGVGLNPEVFHSDSGEPLEGKIYCLPEGVKRLLYVGTIDERKNVEFLVRLAKALSRKLDFRIIMVGEGEEKYRRAFFQLVEEEELNSYFIHVPRVEQKNMAYFYQNADLLLLPSIYEIFGMVILESMYFSVPVISSKTGGASYIIENGRNGFVLESFEVNLWVKLILEFLADSKRYEEVASAAYKRVTRDFMWGSIVERINETVKLW